MVIEKEKIDFSKRNVLMLHQYVAGQGTEPQVCESEMQLEAIGGLDAVDAAGLESFCYTALGHLHGPQRVGSEKVRYAGSLLKYSASEASHHKTMVCGQIDEDGQLQVELAPINLLRDVRCIKGKLEDLLQAAPAAGREDYIFATLTDEMIPLSPRERLENMYPNLVKLGFDRAYGENWTPEEMAQSETASPYALFESFFEKMNKRSMNEEEIRMAQKAFEEVWEGEK